MKDLTKAVEALQLRLIAFEGAIMRRAHYISEHMESSANSAVDTRELVEEMAAAREATSERQGATQTEAVAHAVAETKTPLEEVARQQAQRLAVAKSMNQRWRKLTNVFDERLMALESNEVARGEASDVGVIHRHILHLADGTSVVLSGGSGVDGGDGGE